jgi:Tfp pilus assembly protein PilX
MKRRFPLASDERGSALLLSLTFILITTALGLALFELGTLENRLVYTSHGDARAFEIAHSGVERVFSKLQQTINADGSWVTGATALCSGGSHRGCSDSQFHPVAAGYVSNASFDGGAYAIELRQATAETLSVPCRKSTVTSDVDSSKKICDDVIFVRVTGTVANSAPGYSPTRTIQLLARATQGMCLICGGITASASTGGPIHGNVNIAGSIQITGADGTTSLSLGGGSGQTNSYAALDGTSLTRMPALPLICPIGRSCTHASDLVESLGATLKIAHPVDIAAVSLSGSAKLGQNGDQTYTADATRKGKGPLDGIFVADGCNMPCTDNFTGVTLNSNVFTDDSNITRPFQGQALSFPQLSDSWLVNGVQYTHFACVQGSSCTPPGSPTTQEYFVSRAANVMTLPAGNCVPTPGCAPIITILSTTGLNDAVNPFEMSVSYTDKTGATVNGKVCWDRAKPGLPAGGVSAGPAGLPRYTLEFGAPTCDTPVTASNPMLLYMPSATPATSGLTINRSAGPSDYSYRGSAIIVTNGLVQVEETLQSCQTAGAPCAGHLFTRDDSLAVLTTGNMHLGANTSNINRMMGLFYAGGTATSQKQTNIVGSLTAFLLCFAGGSSPCPSGGNVPSFFQVIPDPSNMITAITSGGTYSIASTPGYWIECKRTPGDTLPSGFCTYTP